MPSDFISLFGSDIDLGSPKSLYSKESVYDLLPKELQLPHCTDQNSTVMSQKSGGGMGSPPPAALASDSSSVISAMTTRSPSSSFPTSSAVHSSATEHDGATSEDASSHRKSEMLPSEVKPPKGCGEKGGEGSQQHHQMTPPKYPVLNISPPPEDLFDDSHMSASQEESLLDSEQSNSIWIENSLSNFSIMSSSSYNDNTEVPRKARKRTPRQRPGAKSKLADGASVDVFDADSAKGPHFVLSQLSPENKATCKGSSDGNQTSGPKGGILFAQYPQKGEGKELKILVQPESQHRARYLTEGSRGSVKDHTQQGFPTIKNTLFITETRPPLLVKHTYTLVNTRGQRAHVPEELGSPSFDARDQLELEGIKEPAVLQVFVGNDTGRVKPHGFYQACRVTGRNTTACREVDIQGTTVIEVPLDPSNNMTLAVDCVGILKLRNADVEARIGVAGSKKKSTRARLVFRVNIPRPDGSILTLQTPSSPILCTQPAGIPEILKKSLHSCSVQGGEELFIIGKNFLKGTKVIFQENVSDDKSWRAEAEIDMELFHQNHLIVKVPPYKDLAVTSPVSVGIYVLTNAGRCHDVQPFTYTPEPVMDVKKETVPPAKPCTFEQKVIDSALVVPVLPFVKTEEVTPMEVSSNSATFKSRDHINQTQQTLEMSNISTSSPSFSKPCRPRDQEQPDGSAFPNKDTLNPIQKPDSSSNTSFEQFLLNTDSLAQERCGSTSGTIVGISQLDDSPQHQLSLLPPDEVAQLEQAVRQLQAKGFCNIQLRSEDPLAKRRQHHLQQNQVQQQQMQQQHKLQQHQIQQQQLQQTQQHQIQQQQLQQTQQHQIQQQQLQQTQQHQIQQHQIQQQQLQQQMQQQQTQQHQIQQHQIQQQQLQQMQQQQQHIQEQQHQMQQQQVLENLQHQLFHPQVQMHCSSEQQGSSQSIVENSGALFQQQSAQQQQQQQAAMFQQAKDLISIQSGFLQQTSSHNSSPLFHTSSSMADAQAPQETHFHTQNTSPTQEHVQASLFQNPVNVLDGSNLTTESQHSAPNMFLAQNALPGQFSANNNQSQQIAFLTSIQKSALEPQSVFQASTQIPPIQQGSPMEQQSTHQASQSQPGSLFQGISQSPITNLPPNQHQSGLVFNSVSSGIAPEQPSSLLFSGQPQLPSLNSGSLIAPEPQNPSVSFSQNNMIPILAEEHSEPMSFQDQSSAVNNQAASKQALFQEQQPMQLAPSSGPGSQASVNLFIAQTDMSRSIVPQEVLFVAQNSVAGLQTTASSPVQQPGSLFQTTINESLNQPNQNHQSNIFLYEIQNECSQLMNSEGNTLSDQIIAISQSGRTQRESDEQMHSLLNPPMAESGNVQNTLTTSQNMEKIDDLLVSLQEQGNNASHSY